jgi:predicted ATP-grasp superfamily ATP-dependent carboligase
VVHADLTSESLLDTLWDIGRSLEVPAVLVPTTDRSVITLSAGRHRLERYYRHSLPDAPVVDQLMSKRETAIYAASRGFSMPRSWDISSEADLDACEHAIPFPCILKPHVKTVAFTVHSPKKAYLIHSVDELRRTYSQVAPWASDVVVQEWIGGPDSALIFSLFYFDDRSVPLASFTGRKLRQFIPYCGTACAAEPFDDAYAEEAGVRFFQACGYRGFGAIEFKRSADGRYYLMEPTVGRTEHLFALAAANGVNLPLVGYRHMAGLPSEPVTRSSRPVRYVDWRRDWRAALFYRRRGELSVSGWVRTLARARQHALFAWDDPVPCVHRLRNRAGNRIRKVGSRARRVLSTPLTRARSGTSTIAPDPPRSIEELESNDVHITAAVAWLCAAQDVAQGGGVSRGFTVIGESANRWQRAYPETTGYIIPTMLECAERYGRPEWRSRALRMAEWLMAIQYPSGGITGGVEGQNLPPVVFNTGMVLFGWCKAYEATRDARYLDAMMRAATFLVSAQDGDGAWRRYTTTRSEPHVHAYDVLVSWSLLLASRHLGEPRLEDAARKNLDFTVGLQQPNGWFKQNGLRPRKHHRPLTHTIGYAAQGLLECGIALDEPRYVSSARLAADAVCERVTSSGYVPGEFSADWKPAAPWCCLTGTAQLAVIWLRLREITGDDAYLAVARRANAYVKATQTLHRSSAGGRLGGIAGSYPLTGDYCRGQMLNWATKYFVDALLAEERALIRAGVHAAVAAAGASASSPPAPLAASLLRSRGFQQW